MTNYINFANIKRVKLGVIQRLPAIVLDHEHQYLTCEKYARCVSHGQLTFIGGASLVNAKNNSNSFNERY